MKVVIQRPVEDPSGLFIRFASSVFEAEFQEPPPAAGGWAILSSIKALDEEAKTTMPFLHKGFFDSHLHMTWAGLYSQGVRLEKCQSLDELKAAVQQKLNSSQTILRGYGWDESMLGLSLAALETRVKGQLPESVPIILYRVCGHSALVNQKFWSSLSESQGPTFITDKILSRVQKLLPQPAIDECEAAFLRAQDSMLKMGISSVGDMSQDETTIAAIKSLAEKGKLLIDVMGVFDAGQAPSVQNNGPLLLRNSKNLGPWDRPAVFSVRHWKKYLDGSFGSRSAWLTKSYEDGESFGESLQNLDELIETSREAVAAGFHLSFHCIGDAALDQALRVGEKLQRVMESRRLSDSSYDFPTSRHRIEHGQLIRADQALRLAEQGFWAVCAQPHHRILDSHFVQARLGRRRNFEEAYIAKSLLNAGVPITLGSDAPIDDFDPDQVIKAVTSHENPKERLSIDEATWAFSTGARLQLGQDPGKIQSGSTVFIQVKGA